MKIKDTVGNTTTTDNTPELCCLVSIMSADPDIHELDCEAR